MAESFESRWECQHDFILEQQAKFSAGMDALRQQTEKNEREIENNSRQIAANSGKIDKRVNVCLSLAHHIERLEASHERLTEAMEQTGYKLNALIEILDKLARRQNGRQ